MAGPQILIVEDDELFRNLLVETLADRGLRVLAAVDGAEAAQMLRDNIGISLLLSDVHMPRMDGYTLVKEALAYNSELKVLMMTGYPGELPPPAVLKAREIRTLAKPFDIDAMCDLVTDMLARP